MPWVSSISATAVEAVCLGMLDRRRRSTASRSFIALVTLVAARSLASLMVRAISCEVSRRPRVKATPLVSIAVAGLFGDARQFVGHLGGLQADRRDQVAALVVEQARQFARTLADRAGDGVGLADEVVGDLRADVGHGALDFRRGDLERAAEVVGQRGDRLLDLRGEPWIVRSTSDAVWRIEFDTPFDIVLSDCSACDAVPWIARSTSVAAAPSQRHDRSTPRCTAPTSRVGGDWRTVLRRPRATTARPGPW